MEQPPRINCFGEIVDTNIHGAVLREGNIFGGDYKWSYLGGTYVASYEDEWEYENDPLRSL